MGHKIVIDGKSLTLSDVIVVAREYAKVEISQSAFLKMKKSRETVEEILHEGKPAYGINTGFGDFSKVSIEKANASQLQNNLILSHCTGLGSPLAKEAVRAMLLLRANALCDGVSGIRPELVVCMVDMLNQGVHPIVPEKGSLGSSGDLAPLSHMVLVMLGHGKAEYKGEVLEGAEAMQRAGIRCVSLMEKEGLALINGTQAMLAVGSIALYDAIYLSKMADIIASMTMEGLRGQLNAFEERVHAVRPHKGQLTVARNMRALCAGSAVIEQARGLRVQDAYALRCIPQVHGAVRDAIEYVKGVVDTELNSVTDNPLIFSEDRAVISGGNFHGEPLALAFDFLGIAISELANISERRLERMVNPALSNGLPAFLVKDGGINSGFMIVQYSAAALVSENKVLAHPASVDSIPSSANQEDHVSMGTIAARKCRDIVENASNVLALELLAACQSIDLIDEEPSKVHKMIFEAVRGQVPYYAQDREIRLDIEKIIAFVKSAAIIEIAADTCCDFN